jgi:arylsulfatase A
VQREHHANVTQMDDAFGQLVNALGELKLEESTFVFFTSDNGPEGDGIKAPGRGSTGGLRGRKRDLHEGGIRVPAIVRWPGKIPANSTLDVPLIGSDVLPTVLAVTGADAASLGNRTLDGVDVLPLLQGASKAVERPQPLFWRLDMAPNAKIAMRVGDMKILADPARDTFEMYDLKTDPQETTDLRESKRAEFGELKKRLLEHSALIEADGPDWWKRLSPSGGVLPGGKSAKGQAQ